MDHCRHTHTYCEQKGFPTDIAQADIEAFWAGVSEKVKAVRIRRSFKEREQLDSCFVEFEDVAERDRVLALELKHGEKALRLEGKYVLRSMCTAR